MKKLDIIGNIRKFNRWGPLVDKGKPVNITQSLIYIGESLLLLLAVFVPLLAIVQFITTFIEVAYIKIVGNKERKKVVNKLLKYADKIEKDIGLLYLEDHEFSTTDRLYSLYDGCKPYQLYDNIHHPTIIMPWNLDIFIHMFISKYNWQYDTMYANDHTIQCRLAKRRSIGDIYLICKFYYKDITIIDVIEALMRLSNEKLIHSSRCGTINKYVFTAGSSCYNGNLEMFDDILTWNELVKILKDK